MASLSYVFRIGLALITVFSFYSQEVSSAGEPKFRGEPQKMYVRHLGNSVKLKCPVTGTDNPFPNKTLVSWFKGANVIHNTHSNWSRFLIRKDKHLKIVNVKESDAGTYKCRGQNQYGLVDLIIRLKVELTRKPGRGPAAPIFKRSPTNFTSTIGTKAKLLCRVWRVDASSTYWWTRNGIRIKDPIKYRVRPFRFLEIRKVEKADAGEYICWAKNEGGQIQRIINFVVKVPNLGNSTKEIIMVKPITQSTQNVTRFEGEDVEFTCKAISDSLPHFQWITLGLNGTVNIVDPGLSEDEYVWKSDNLRWHGVKLRLVNVTQEDENDYYCMVGDDRGYDYQKFQLKVLPRPITTSEIIMVRPITQSTQNVTKFEGEDVEFTCKAISDNLPHFQWITLGLNGTVNAVDPGLSEDEYIWKSDNPRWHGVKLRLVNVTQEDENDYYCMVGDDRGYAYQKFQLIVLPRPVTTSDAAPYFTERAKMKRSYVLASPGHSAKMVCSANGSPTPTVTWYKDGKMLKYMLNGVTPLTSSNFVIRFKILNPGHSGKYKCVVSNKAGNISMTYTLEVKEVIQEDFSKPAVQNIAVREGENVTITCKAVSDRLPHFKWLALMPNGSFEILNSKLSQIVPKIGNDRLHAQTLRLVNVTREDDKVYYCMVGDDRGYDYQAFHLRVSPRSATSQVTNTKNGTDHADM